MATRNLIRPSGRALTPAAVDIVTPAGYAEPTDWIGNRYRAIDNYFSSTSSMVAIWPPHGAVVKTTNPVLCYATSQAYNNAALDTNQYKFRVKVAGAGDGTAVEALCPLASSQVVWPTDLAPGDYEVAFYDPGNSLWTSWRRFTVAADAVHEDAPAHGTAYALVAANTGSRFVPADLSSYAPGGEHRAFYDAMVTRTTTPAALPAAATINANSQLAQQELTYAADLQHLYGITGSSTHRDVLVTRMFGDGSTTGMVYWPWATLTNDLTMRFGGMALAIAFDATKAALTAPQRTAAVAALAACVDQLLNVQGHALTSSTGAFATQGGRWPGQQSLFGGHAHNCWLVATMICAALVGEEAGAVGTANSSITPNVALAMKWAGFTLRVMDPMLMDDGSYHEGKGYGMSSTDFQAAMVALGNAVGFDWARSVRTRSWARTFTDSFPLSDSFHAGPGGDDDSVQSATDFRHVSGAQRGGIAQAPLQIALGQLAVANLQASGPTNGKAIDLHWLKSITAGAHTAGFPLSVPTRHWTALHTDPFDKRRTSVWVHHQPDAAWNHAINAPGGWQMVSKGQSLFQHALLNDNNNQGLWSRREGGSAETGNGVMVFGTLYKCASNGFRWHNSGRRPIARRMQFSRDAGGIVKITEDLDQAVDVCLSTPVSSNATGYLYNLIGKPGAAEEDITVTVATVSGSDALSCTVSGSSSEAIANSYATGGYIDCASFSGQALRVGGAYAPGDTFTFEIRKASKARDYKVWLPEGVLIHGKHYVFPTARNVGYRFNTRDVRTPAGGAGTVTGDILKFVIPTGTSSTGHPNGNSISFEVSGVTGGVTNFALTNGVWHGNVVDAGGAVQVAGMTALGVGAGTLTGTIRVNIGPSAASGLTLPVNVNSFTRAAGELSKAQAIPLYAPTGRVLNNPAWFTPASGFGAQSVNGNADEYGGSLASSPVYDRWHNVWQYGSLSEFLAWCGIFAPAEVAITAYSQSTTGTTPNRLTVVNLTVNGTPYAFTISEATGLIL